MNITKKSLIISENIDASEEIIKYLKTQQLEIVTHYPSLHSISEIKKKFSLTGNPSFIKTELSNFIMEIGFPLVVFVDYRIDLGVKESAADSSLLILLTLIISYIILSKGKEFSKIRANLLILINKSQEEEVKLFRENPIKILDIIKTKNKTITAFIQELLKNPGLFSHTFNINWLNIDLSPQIMIGEVDKYIKDIQVKIRLASVIENKIKPPLDTNNVEAAKIIYRLDKDRVSSDGEITDIGNDQKFEQLDIGTFFIFGNWVNRNQLEVTNKLKDAILNGTGLGPFETSDKIIINIGEKCIIDGTILSSLSQLLLRDLISYENIKVHVDEKNESILKKLAGYSLIKKYINKTFN